MQMATRWFEPIEYKISLQYIRLVTAIEGFAGELYGILARDAGS